MEKLDTKRGSKIKNIYIPKWILAILVLLYTVSVLIAVKDNLDSKIYELEGENIFSSPQAAIIFLRICVAGWAAVFTMLQAGILSVLFAIAMGLPRPKINQSWGYVLIPQMLFSFSVFIFYAVGKDSYIHILYMPLFQHVMGVVTVIVFALFASSGVQMENKRIVAFSLLAIAANSAMLALSNQVII